MKVGDYVRLVRKNITYIRKINSIYLKRMGAKKINEIIVDKPFDYRYTINDDKILKSSSNIIDLIEVGDYVNGYYVEDIRHRYDGEMITILELATGSNYFQTPIYDDEIESIVTKEQFESMEYKVI